jgi:hypothetical protein
MPAAPLGKRKHHCYGAVTPAMNPSTTSESKESAHLEKLRLQISTDIEAMQQKESSLREYEQRLRLLVEHAHHSQPAQPPAQYFVNTAPATPNLDAEWEKYYRAHSLLEAARRGLCDDRLALKDREEKLTQREVEVMRREAWVKVRELELANQAEARAKEPVPPKPKPSFTMAPFLAARNLLTRQQG